ncbi:ADP-ribosylglycohydrolase family protein [Lapillicoccus jejuensis]|uniref:ADP-ribosylglycohydrolase n=1 Tax=Lapillicoccus jejuensis TaxID=402171 RepID=A0A542E069_9MICO|nr:ADP-ribosylglycohydrolase family protein [Lapillicoccus jejuensis]TQJ08574.1 ADP-ribosylglycohydrolase [Lapillicoccus jejuensis]
MELDEGQRDRARGAVLGSAAGDALGAAYEFGTRALGDGPPRMLGGGLGNFAPGEWTDDTTMAWAVLDAAATYGDLRGAPALDAVASRFREWWESGPADIGNQTRSVLGLVGPSPTGAALTATSHALHERTGHTAGNGSLMRTGPVALAHLGDAAAAADAARAVGDLTHHDDRALEACALCTLAVRHAVVHGELDVRVGLGSLGADAAARWASWLDEAEQREPGSFSPNGFVVTALQAAWSAIAHTPVSPDDPPRHLADALETAIRIGDDTDTVAAIAGALLGARWGLSAVPAEWLGVLHGYPGLRADDLVALADRAVGHA